MAKFRVLPYEHYVVLRGNTNAVAKVYGPGEIVEIEDITKDIQRAKLEPVDEVQEEELTAEKKEDVKKETPATSVEKKEDAKKETPATSVEEKKPVEETKTVEESKPVEENKPAEDNKEEE